MFSVDSVQLPIGAAFDCMGEGFLDLLVILTAHTDRGSRIVLFFQGSANASIEATGTMCRDADHSA
jgi:hypothetical protein